MKKSILLILVLLLLLTACQGVPVSTEDPTVSTPSSGLTPPSSSVTPPLPSSAPPTVPTTTPTDLDKTGHPFIYKGYAPFLGINPDCSECTVGHLYWVDKTTEKVTPILEEQTQESIVESGYVYYVKTDAPTKIYRTPIDDFSCHEMIYESTHGTVRGLAIDTFVIRKELILQFVADEKKFIVLDFATGVEHVLMEQYYIKSAYFSGSCTDTWAEQDTIIFRGKCNKDDTIKVYEYFCNTREIREIEEQETD